MSGPAHAQAAVGLAPDPVAGLSAEQVARYQKFTQELRCLVCQNQTIAESQAPLAQDLRIKVSEQLAAGRTDAEIVDWLTARYGDYVLYRPPLKASTLLLWVGPFALVLLGLLFAWRYSRRSLAVAARGTGTAGPAAAHGLPPAAASAQDAAVQRLLAGHRTGPVMPSAPAADAVSASAAPTRPSAPSSR